MKDHESIPNAITEAFPIVSGSAFVERFTLPDTTFDIYRKDTEDFIALVTTDYADPQDQSRELKSISGRDKFEFTNLVKPYSTNGETVAVLEHDDMKGDFFTTVSYNNYKLYCYLANLKMNR